MEGKYWGLLDAIKDVRQIIDPVNELSPLRSMTTNLSAGKLNSLFAMPAAKTAWARSGTFAARQAGVDIVNDAGQFDDAVDDVMRSGFAQYFGR